MRDKNQSHFAGMSIPETTNGGVRGGTWIISNKEAKRGMRFCTILTILFIGQ